MRFTVSWDLIGNSLNMPRPIAQCINTQSIYTLKLSYGRLRHIGKTMKRCFELSAALVGLIVLLPVWIIVSIAVRLSSPGPTLFRQIRVGRGGRDFALLKFRTMTVRPGSEKGAFDAGDASRVTKVGCFLPPRNSTNCPNSGMSSGATWRLSVPVPRSVNGSRSILTLGNRPCDQTGHHGSGRNPLSG